MNDLGDQALACALGRCRTHTLLWPPSRPAPGRPTGKCPVYMPDRKDSAPSFAATPGPLSGSAWSSTKTRHDPASLHPLGRNGAAPLPFRPGDQFPARCRTGVSTPTRVTARTAGVIDLYTY